MNDFNNQVGLVTICVTTAILVGRWWRIRLWQRAEKKDMIKRKRKYHPLDEPISIRTQKMDGYTWAAEYLSNLQHEQGYTAYEAAFQLGKFLRSDSTHPFDIGAWKAHDDAINTELWERGADIEEVNSIRNAAGMYERAAR